MRGAGYLDSKQVDMVRQLDDVLNMYALPASFQEFCDYCRRVAKSQKMVPCACYTCDSGFLAFWHDDSPRSSGNFVGTKLQTPGGEELETSVVIRFTSYSSFQ